MIIDAIKNKINIIDLAREYGLKVKKVGGHTYRAKCIFHNDNKTPNLTFDTEKNVFRCFACRERGDVINFYAKLNKISNKEAIQKLKEIYNIKDLNPGGLIIKSGPDRKQPVGMADIDNILKALMVSCGDLSPESLGYLTGNKRGLTLETIRHFKIFDIQDYKKVKKSLFGLFDLVTLREAGLLFEKCNRFIFIQYKIIIPIIENGKFVCLRGRYFYKGLDNPGRVNKYESLNGISTRGMLFNVDILTTLKAGDKLFLCEGEFDTMITEQNGLKAVGLLGVSNYNPDMLKRLKDYDLVIALDNREEGKRLTNIIGKDFKALTGREAKKVNLPEGIKDMTEYFIKHPGKTTLKQGTS